MLIFSISMVAKYGFHQLMLQGTTKGFSCSKVSKISLIDLAGMDSDTVDDGGSQCLRESSYVKKSLSQLG